MKVLKAIEQVAKRILAVVAATLLWRPLRTTAAKARLAQPNRVLFVRIDDRVGEALLMTPALSAFKQCWPSSQIHLLVHPSVGRVLDGHPALDGLVRFGSRGGGLAAVVRSLRAVRRERYEVVVDFGNWAIPSVTSAVVARLAGPHAAVIGPSVWPSNLFHTISVRPLEGTRNEALQRIHLLSPLQVRGQAPISFRTPVIGDAFRSLIAQLGEQRLAVLNPGSRLAARRAPPEAFAAAAAVLWEAGVLPIVAWGPGEEGLAQAIAAKVPGTRVAPATDLDELAVLLQRAQLTVCNNTGPMHLSVALGTPTLGLFLGMDVERWGHSHPPHRMVELGTDPEEPVAAKVRKEVKDFIDWLGKVPAGGPKPPASIAPPTEATASPGGAPRR